MRYGAFVAEATKAGLVFARSSSYANILQYAGNGEPDASAMFARAIAASRRIYVPAGTYVLNNVNWPSNTEIFGDGDATILKMPTAASLLISCDSGSASVANNIANLKMSRVQLLATCDVDGFSEHQHLVALSGVSNVLFEDVLFKGFRGDGAYIGSGDSAGVERHNENVSFVRCRFDGINRQNRNGISFIDINGGLVDGCVFTNCTAPNMPGPIDMEPNPSSPFAIIKNVQIQKCSFINNGGGVGEVSVQIPATVTAPPQNITVVDCVSSGYAGTGSFASFNTNRVPTASSVENDYRFIRNNVRDGNCPFIMADGKRITFDGNTFVNMKSLALVGYGGTTNVVRDIKFLNTEFIRVGTVNAIGLTICNASYVKISKCLFSDCGTGNAGSYAIDFDAGASSFVDIEDTIIETPTGKTLVGIVKEAAHTFTPATNSFYRNRLNGLGNWFQAEESDSIVTTYAPVVGGASTVGAGTYNQQTGLFYRLGKRVFFKIRLAVAAGHTGTGLIQVSLPLPAASVGPAGSMTLCPAGVNGLVTSGGVTARLTPAASLNGVQGTLRIYASGTGQFNQITIPAGAFEIECSGEYTTSAA
ncbi:hypothetical protein GTP44_13490 [Duganella sp. FT50W]|uniref:Right handed beta helix domain-containing protein n=1 Tax=Duganella lactea TaxID=2692173 RepID=A0A6L8MIL1_9BURK|nr:right-handed parallel beta-helix repeat-containing protein [Duganella lactea]MYM82967.1 hypothetical protein [Duganella lactea]